jgi:uncharacterized membrane protein
MGLGDSTGWASRPGYSGQPQVRTNALSEAWELFKQRPMTWILTTLLVLFCYSAASGVVVTIAGPPHIGHRGGFRMPLLFNATTAVHAVLTAVVGGFFVGGMFRMACRQVRGLAFGVDTLFSITDVLPNLILGSAFYALVVLAYSSCCILPGLVAAGLSMFAVPLIVDARMPAFDAIATSWRVLKSQWLSATMFHLLVSFVAGLGSLCCVGLVFTAPLYCLAITVLYRDFFLAQPAAPDAKPAPRDPYF